MHREVEFLPKSTVSLSWLQALVCLATKALMPIVLPCFPPLRLWGRYQSLFLGVPKVWNQYLPQISQSR
jgi:hypothetical protein